MENDLLDLNDQLNNGDFEDNLPDPNEVAGDWDNIEENISEEPVEDEDPFAAMPSNIPEENDNFTLEDIIAQIMDLNDPLITEPMEIVEDELKIVAIFGAFPDGPDPPADQFLDEE